MVNVEIGESGISVTGDFFIQPAEAREDIEYILEESEDLSENNIVEKIRNLDAKLIGFSAEDVLEAFQKASGGKE